MVQMQTHLLGSITLGMLWQTMKIHNEIGPARLIQINLRMVMLMSGRYIIVLCVHILLVKFEVQIIQKFCRNWLKVHTRKTQNIAKFLFLFIAFMSLSFCSWYIQHILIQLYIQYIFYSVLFVFHIAFNVTAVLDMNQSFIYTMLPSPAQYSIKSSS